MVVAREKQDFRVLLAEDNDVNCKLASRMLKKLGYRVDTVGNGIEAIAAVQRHPYHIVLMDLQMPEMDGLTATRWIMTHSSQLVRMPRVIALTANTLPEDRQRCQDSGMVDFIGKPISFAVLAQVLDKWTEKMS